MSYTRWLYILGSAAVLCGAASALPAQGVTTGAISGVVSDESGQPMDAVQVLVVNRGTGFSSGAVTRANGRYLVPGLEVGGPYSVTARRIGSAPETRDNVFVTLSQTTQVDFRLRAQAAVLSGVSVTAEAEGSAFSPTRTGAQTTVSDSLISRLPTAGRNFTDFVRLAPQVVTSPRGDISAGGVSSRLNSFQVDGASQNDLYGLAGGFGIPGSASGARSVPLDAIKQFQVLLSPFDVRQGNFAGLLLNAVTKSGTNRLEGTGYYFYRDEGLARNLPFIRSVPFDVKQFGATLGGPIVKDRVHFFIAPELQTRSRPATGPYVTGSTANGVNLNPDTLARFVAGVKKLGLADPGTSGPVSLDNPLTNIFGRVDVQLPGFNSRAVLRHSYAKAEDADFSRTPTTFRLYSNATPRQTLNNSSVGQLYTTLPNGASNELIVGYNTIRDLRPLPVRFPQVDVTVGTVTLRAGSDQFNQGNILRQRILELTDNYSFPWRSHNLTVGTKNEFYHIYNYFAESSIGVYTFRNLDSLEAGNPNTYRISTDLGGGIAADFGAATLGLYAQDQWQVSNRFNLTYGLRADLPLMFDQPKYVPVVDTVFGRRTDRVPSGDVQLSPRVGFNFSGGGERQFQLRGGMGLFTGRPPFVFVGNAYSNSGAGFAVLQCNTATLQAPNFTADPSKQPLNCRSGTGLSTGIIGAVNTLDEHLKFPQSFRASFGADRDIGWGLVATTEALYTRFVNNFFYRNLNLAGPTGVDRNGRVLYATQIAANGVPTVNLKSSRFSEVVEPKNQSDDYAYTLTGQLRKRFSAAFEATAAYNYTVSRDVATYTSDRAISNFQRGRMIGARQFQEDAGVGISQFDRPHRIILNGTYTAPWDRYATAVSFNFVGQSGTPYAYYAGRGGSSGTGDLNGDGQIENDLIYVPRNAADTSEIFFQATAAATVAQQQSAFESFIKSSKCLRSQRGRIMERNSCRSPWQDFLDVSVRQNIPTFSGQTFALQLDIFNFLNLLNKDWGTIELPTANPDFPQNLLLSHVAQRTITGATYSATNFLNQKPVFTFDPTYREFSTQNRASNFYQLQLSARYSF
ncbi:MAG TPA: carboxypeptidase regulatory-like domain-containing protein [Gemmatimonadaceae bacterium]|nr:carboxypeptidase regulatory-like domain-containing protein [Gemmatimonadaceae bacterium]